MNSRKRTISTLILAGALVGLAVPAALASTNLSQDKAKPSSPPKSTISLTAHPTNLQFVDSSGYSAPYPTKALNVGDRVFAEDQLLRGGVSVGSDFEACQTTFSLHEMCEDTLVLPEGTLEASWIMQWPSSGTQGPTQFDGVIAGGTNTYAGAHGTFRATTLSDNNLSILAQLH